jgi:hypothetical protein
VEHWGPLVGGTWGPLVTLVGGNWRPLIHLFTNSDAILNHDALWVIQGKNPNSKAFNVVWRHNMIIFFINTFLRTMRQCK